jgi:hypothetical protein
MTTRRIILLILLIIPMCFFAALGGSPLSNDEHNGLEILALIFSIPIALLNAWEWQSPETLDELFPKRKLRTASSPLQLTPSQKKSTALILVGAILVIFVIGCNFVALSFIRRAFGLVPTGTPEYDIPAIQTAAVQTALAPLRTIEPTKSTELTTLTPGAEATDLFTLTGTPSPGQTIGSIGERIEHDGIALTVTSMSSVDSIDGLTNAKEGYVFLVIEVIVENSSRVGQTPYDPTFFTVTDSMGVQYAALSSAPDPALSVGSLTTGDQVSGNIAFEVDTTVTGIILAYEPAITADAPIRIDVDLGQ